MSSVNMDDGSIMYPTYIFDIYSLWIATRRGTGSKKTKEIRAVRPSRRFWPRPKINLLAGLDEHNLHEVRQYSRGHRLKYSGIFSYRNNVTQGASEALY